MTTSERKLTIYVEKKSNFEVVPSYILDGEIFATTLENFGIDIYDEPIDLTSHE